MADNLSVSESPGKYIATDDVGGKHYQRFKLDGGGDGVSEPIGGDAANGLDVDVTRSPAGETIELAASAARTDTAGTNGTAFPVGARVAFAVLLDITNKDADAGDTLDVYIDMLIGGTWVNAVHFTQAIGTGAAAKEYALIMPTSGLTTLTTVTSDATSGVVRPEIMGSQIRARWVIVDTGTDDASFTFSVTAWAI